MARASTKSGSKPTAAKAKKSQGKSTKATNDIEDDKSYVGRRVSKKFGGEIFNGTVSKYFPKDRLWGIKYDDGDAEEMDYNDLKRAINLFDKHNKKAETTKKKATTTTKSKPKEQPIVAAEKTAAVTKKVGDTKKKATSAAKSRTKEQPVEEKTTKKRATRSKTTGEDELEELEAKKPSSGAKSKRAKRGESNEEEHAKTKGTTKGKRTSTDKEAEDAPQRKTRGNNAKKPQPAEDEEVDAKKKSGSSQKFKKQDAPSSPKSNVAVKSKNGTKTKQPDAAISSSEQIEVVSSSDAADTSSTTKNFRVVRITYPKNQPTSCNEEHVVGEYSTREEANEAARSSMHNTAQFEDWGETQFANKPPPYSSADGPFEVTADEDEYVDFYVMDIAKTNSNTKQVREAALAATASATKAAEPSPASTKKAKKSSSTGSAAEAPQQKLKPERKFGKVAARDIIVDEHLFHHNPCRIPGGESNHPKKYPNFHKKTGSFGFLIQRLSDRNYAMRALCLDGYGAQYNTYKKEHVSYISVVWYPPNNLKDHRDDATIVDGCHLDLIDPTDGKTYLTGRNMKKAVENAGVPVECLFLNGAQSNLGSDMTADDVASTISMCTESLLCVSLTECKLNGAILNALASCTKLRGLIIENCQIWGKGDDKPTDAMLAAVLDACVDLQWCFVKSSIFGANCWDVLANTDTCPNLEVLWIDAPTHTNDRVDVARGDINIITRALNGRAKKLKICMINPDEENNSRFVIGGSSKTNRLNGRSREEASVRSSGNYLSSI